MIATAQQSPSKPLPGAPEEAEHHHAPLPDKAVFVLPERVGLTAYGVRYMESTANRIATNIRVCLVDEQKSGKSKRTAATVCNSRYADSVATVINTLRDAQVNIDSLPDALKQMEAGPALTNCNISPI